ncbi:P-loop containing nucleoside triphosphate hydrolase protein [Cercophora samala]|uniref:ATP-dependent DNA helicase n=1 Tax=Cercophora samala TaxID=330535 RepID=A0AA39ZK63_9PEZI|nr:P-loop containing nucleoside triphosphate hydrolase protein [Cercophora samala]
MSFSPLLSDTSKQTRRTHQSISMSRKRKASPDTSHGRVGRPAPVEFDPWARPLTLQASTVAEHWPRVRMQIEMIDDNDLDSEDSTRLLAHAATLRREHTRLTADGKMLDHVLQPASQTCEPPPVKQRDFLPEPDLSPDPFVDPALDRAIKDPVGKDQQLQQSLDVIDPRSGAEWPMNELVEVERQRLEHNRLVDRHTSGSQHKLPGEHFLEQSSINSREPEGLTPEPEPQPTPPLGERPPLCPEQEGVVRLAEQGANIFYTGSAGCGKSTVLHEIRRRLGAQGKVVKAIAPTGLVALAINGTTTYTFMGWVPSDSAKSLNTLCKATANRGKGYVRAELRKVDALIIDEISMVDNHFFQRMDKVLRYIRRQTGPEEMPPRGVDPGELPFGGIQLIITGDFCQLAPVRPFEYCVSCGFELQRFCNKTKRCNNQHCGEDLFRDEDQYAFSSNAWKQCNFQYVHLKTIHRQQDGQFKALLKKCRTGVAFSEEEIKLLLEHKSCTKDAIRLMSTRLEVRRTNMAAYDRLPGPAFLYRCHDGRIIEGHHPRLQNRYAYRACNDELSHRVIDFGHEHRFDEILRLKEGMSVLLLVNLSLPEGLCNGSQGTIVGFSTFSMDALTGTLEDNPGLDPIQQQAIDTFARSNLNSENRGGIVLPVVRFQNGTERTILPECLSTELGHPAPYSYVWRVQIPLTAGYALTIHKAQGMTLDSVIIQLDRVFQDEQVYVALSRARTMEGLKIVGAPAVLKKALAVNPQVRRFMEKAKWIEFQ